MTTAEARATIKKFSFLLGNELTFRGRSYTVKRLQANLYNEPAVVTVVLENRNNVLVTVNFEKFYNEWKAGYGSTASAL